MTDVLIKGAKVLGDNAADILVRDGMIAQIGSIGSTRSSGERDGARLTVVDADGLVVLPGLVDLHTHLREPGREDAETVASGSAAAAARPVPPAPMAGSGRDIPATCSTGCAAAYSAAAPPTLPQP